MSDSELGLRERKKLRTREAIEQAAWRLFEAQGFDRTTVEDIAAAADISPRTFFRYFDSKEAVMFGDWRGDLEGIERFINSRPADEPPMVTLREAAIAAADLAEMQGLRHRLHHKLVADASKVGDYEREVVLPAMEDSLSRAVARRIDVDPDKDLRTQVLASTALAAALAAKRHWIALDQDGSYGDLVRQAFEILAEAGRFED